MPMPLPLHGASMLHVENECFPIKDIFRIFANQKILMTCRKSKTKN